jgi:hypothetical protein
MDKKNKGTRKTQNCTDDYQLTSWGILLNCRTWKIFSCRKAWWYYKIFPLGWLVSLCAADSGGIIPTHEWSTLLDLDQAPRRHR